MLDFQKPIRTRDGREVIIYDNCVKEAFFCIHGRLVGGNSPLAWTKEGEYHIDIESELDLVNVPEKMVIFLNIYKEYVAASFSESDAVRNATMTAKEGPACLKVAHRVEVELWL